PIHLYWACAAGTASAAASTTRASATARATGGATGCAAAAWRLCMGRFRSGCLDHSIMAKQGIQFRVPSSERAKRVDGRSATAYRQDLVEEAPAGFGDARRRVRPGHGLLERGVGVGRQHFGPLVAVVAGRVAAGEDVQIGRAHV